MRNSPLWLCYTSTPSCPRSSQSGLCCWRHGSRESGGAAAGRAQANHFQEGVSLLRWLLPLHVLYPAAHPSRVGEQALRQCASTLVPPINPGKQPPPKQSQLSNAGLNVYYNKHTGDDPPGHAHTQRTATPQLVGHRWLEQTSRGVLCRDVPEEVSVFGTGSSLQECKNDTPVTTHVRVGKRCLSEPIRRVHPR
jgi:hypothetical protein